MESFYIEKISEVKKSRAELEKKLSIKIKITGKNVAIAGHALNEYEAELVFDAIRFGFSQKKARTLKDDDFIFKKVHIKSHTKRNLKDILSRLIGTKGRTRKIISELSHCDVLIKDGEVGIIGDVEDVENTEIAIVNIIKGSKQTNMYRYLEKIGKTKKSRHYR